MPRQPDRLPVADALRAAAAEESARIVATVVRVTGDWDLAEDCLQDAFVRAAARWPVDGIPDAPGAWLTTVARHRAIDHLRRVSVERRAVRAAGFESELARMGEPGAEEDTVHDRLALILTCCHPALPLEGRVALTMRTVLGMSVAEIARAFLVSESTMDKRLVRARAKIKNAGIPFRVPQAARWPERMPAVLAVLYLLFSEGYSATESDGLLREPLAKDAIGLLREVILAVGERGATPEAEGLLALMLFQHARRRARTGEEGRVVPLELQDRGAWDGDELLEASAAFRRATRALYLSDADPGAYYLQAAIAAAHATAQDFASTDFGRVLALYELLRVIEPSPVLDLNRAVAEAMAHGPEAALPMVEALDDAGELAGYYLLPATLADLLRRVGRVEEAEQQYRRASELAPSEAERRYLASRIAEVRAGR